jgi:hypothetical protein
MRLKERWILILVVIVFLCLFSWTRYGSSSSRVAWEYKIEVLSKL